MSDEEKLVRQAQAGDTRALTQLYEENFTRTYRYIYVRVGNKAEAEDLTQQVFLKVLGAIGSYRWRGAPFIAWVLRIAQNQIIDYYRRKAKHKEVPIDEMPGELEPASTGDDPADIAEQTMEIERVVKLIQRLPSAQREVVTLRFGGGLSVAETAKTLGKSEGTVKALQFNAMVSLRKLLDENRKTRET